MASVRAENRSEAAPVASARASSQVSAAKGQLPRLRLVLSISSAVAAVLTLRILVPRLDSFAAAASLARRPHLPDLALFTAQPLAVRVHLLAALGAIGVGAIMMLSRKGQTFHRRVGSFWAGLMMAVAISSLFISGGINGARWSFLHLFSGWVIVFVPLAVLAARSHYVTGHRALMMMMFYGTLLITGALAFLPGRLMWRLFFD